MTESWDHFKARQTAQNLRLCEDLHKAYLNQLYASDNLAYRTEFDSIVAWLRSQGHCVNELSVWTLLQKCRRKIGFKHTDNGKKTRKLVETYLAKNLTDQEYHALRQMVIGLLRSLGMPPSDRLPYTAEGERVYEEIRKWVKAHRPDLQPPTKTECHSLTKRPVKKSKQLGNERDRVGRR